MIPITQPSYTVCMYLYEGYRWRHDLVASYLLIWDWTGNEQKLYMAIFYGYALLLTLFTTVVSLSTAR